ncbi:hypothetical protein J6590_015428 [Homalodisca vitripennis]|nr:hypothetical protein J6590_015428 [Homalodisca vitripennis]
MKVPRISVLTQQFGLRCNSSCSGLAEDDHRVTRWNVSRSRGLSGPAAGAFVSVTSRARPSSWRSDGQWQSGPRDSLQESPLYCLWFTSPNDDTIIRFEMDDSCSGLVGDDQRVSGWNVSRSKGLSGPAAGAFVSVTSRARPSSWLSDGQWQSGPRGSLQESSLSYL